jgi:ABC-type Fe3+-hydroxamate transport system, periplasmic component
MRKKLKIINNALLIILTFFCVSETWAGTVTDEIGREVNIKRFPQRIVSLAPGITETLWALNLDDKIVGVTTFCDWPAAARTKPQIGGFTNPSIEKIVSLKPDLIIATLTATGKIPCGNWKELALPSM